MEKEETISFRATKKTREDIENIRKQMIELHGFEKEELTDSFIIRHAISSFNRKVKYFIYPSKEEYYKKTREKIKFPI